MKLDLTGSCRYLIQEWIEKNRNWMEQITADLEAIPEPAFREFQTAKYIKEQLLSFGLEVEQPLPTAVWGKRQAPKYSKQPIVAFVADMDAVYCPGHPKSNHDNGYAHACGHHIQIVHGLALIKFWQEHSCCRSLPFEMQSLFCPAEEFSTLSTSHSYLEHIKSGKQLLLQSGVFAAFTEILSSHVYPNLPSNTIMTGVRHPGFLTLRIYWSKSNPLKTSLQIHTILDSFYQSQRNKGVQIQVQEQYQIVGQGNIYVIESYFIFRERLKEKYIIDKLVPEIRRALKNKQLDAELKLYPGYQPFVPATNMQVKMSEVVARSFPTFDVIDQLTWLNQGATDLGDVSQTRPVIQPYFSGCTGELHEASFEVSSIEEAVIFPVTLFLHYLLGELDTRL